MLLTNDQTNRVMRLTMDGKLYTMFVAHAAIHGPYKRKITMDSLLSYFLGMAIVLAIATVALDITIWRP